jgi:glyoxylase-like metal-dependent hydrolase (beta-lactamase superfamily II)
MVTALVAGLGRFGAGIADIRGIAATHAHPDHYGLCGRLREESGAWVALHAHDALLIESADGTGAAAEARSAWLRGWGLAAGELAELEEAMARIAGFSTPARPDVILQGGDTVEIDARSLGVVHTPGHSPGHVCFVDEAAGVVYTGDHVLARTTPNVSVHPGSGDNPLADYVASLRRTAALGSFEALPGHEERFAVGPRSLEIVAHHEEQLGFVATIVANGAETVREVAERMPWLREWETFGPFDRHSALGEAHAHLALLERRGSLVRVSEEPLRWQPAKTQEEPHANGAG